MCTRGCSNANLLVRTCFYTDGFSKKLTIYKKSATMYISSDNDLRLVSDVSCVLYDLYPSYVYINIILYHI